MELDAIPGLSDEVNSEFHSMIEEFSGHVDEQGDANDTSDEPSTFVDLDRSVEDQKEDIVREYFDARTCLLDSRERLLVARQLDRNVWIWTRTWLCWLHFV